MSQPLSDPPVESEVRRTPSGIEIPVVATPDSRHRPDDSLPGEYPFTRGIFPDGFRGRLWTFRQYSGFGSAEESNARYRFLLERGQTGLSVALDLPTQCGYDPVDPLARSEVGKVGVSLSNLAEMERLFEGIDLGAVSTSFTINGSAAMIFAMYLAAADKAGVPRAKLTGTIQNDILKEYVARGTWIFPVRPALRLVADSILYANAESPRFNPISIAGAHVRDAGSSAVEEMGFTLANGLCYVDELIARGADVEQFAKRLSFFFYVHMNFFEEVAKFRAGRRLWARLMKERYGAKSEKAQQFRFGVVCGGSSLTAAQPYNNVVRVAVETMAATLGGAQSVFTCAFDEAFQLPTEHSAELALRTQQVIAYESGIADTVDPLGGSHYVEYLTDEMEAAIEGVIQEIADYGGVVRAIEDGYLQRRIARSAHERKSRVDRGDSVIVGVNRFRNEAEDKQVGEAFDRAAGAAAVVEKYERVLDERDAAGAERTLDALERAAADANENLMPYLVDCCHAYATVGEMVARLKCQWGEFDEPVRLLMADAKASLAGKRILVAKPGLDGHDVGAKVIALALRDAGAEVIYTGLRKSPDYIARVAAEENVDAVGLSILSGSHLELVADTVAALREEQADDVALFVGGTIPRGDFEALRAAGVAAVFDSEMALEDIVESVGRCLA